MKDILDIFKYLVELGLLKGISEKLQNETKEEKGGYFGMLLDIFGARLLGYLLAGKNVIRVGEEAIRAGQCF